MIGCIQMKGQNLSVKSSMTMLATTTLNAEIAMPVSKSLSVHVPVLYNPWVFKQNSRIQQLTAMPGVRYWKQQYGVNYFCSAYLIASRYHMGGWLDKKYRYDGVGFGAGIGGGYSYVLTDHWNLDFEIGVGAVYVDYDKCAWQKNSRFYENVKGIRLAVTKLDVSFIYFF